jgi:threonine aldolase
MKIIDLRSDTVTRPTPAMRQAILDAEVGDDVFGEDPTVNRLQVRVAELFGKEAALFMPSGVMGNQVCIKAHTQPGDEIIVEQDSHIHVYETAAPSVLSGVQMMAVPGTRGMISAEQIKGAIRPKAYYLPRTALICLENTHGLAGGTVYPIQTIKQIRELAMESGIKMHLDGARIWNAWVAAGIHPAQYAEYFDSLMVCFSKGLGAPIGSIIIGSREFIERARTYRKMFGGGMRQVGILAAAALYALDHNVERLREDHEKARALAAAIGNLASFKVDSETVQTNMVIAQIRNRELTQESVLAMLQEHGVLLTPERGNCVRAVTHLDVTMDKIHQAISVFGKIFR